ncbi:MAG: hypothetical protein LBD98_04015 [Endomicrobium sp.]|jgi:hypothetical protein|nr:hypothetical protein [Endomicrobium sp.]
MKKFITAVFCFGLLLSASSNGYSALPSQSQEEEKIIKFQLTEKQFYKTGAFGLGGFAAYRFIANMQAGAGAGVMLINGLRHLGNGVLVLIGSNDFTYTPVWSSCRLCYWGSLWLSLCGQLPL